MKISDKITSLIFCFVFLLLITSCQDTITDFGFDATISGKVVDEAGNIVPGDITTTTLMIITLGEGDQSSIDLRVKGDGTFKNSKMFPKKTKIWIEGPVTYSGGEVTADLAANNNFVHDFVVIPFITIDKPSVSNITATTVNVSYNMAPDNGKEIEKREVYCSTNPYPTTTTGSGPFFHTVEAELDSDNGTITLEGLTSGTDYFLRIAAQTTDATGMNFSEQVTFSTP